ncbi:MAG: NUDIX hydrolase [Leptospiraceae bacterium]|nr:NUDIX hydrolase [Leptospiraceae bacterium]
MEKFTEALKVKEWIKELEKNGIIIKSITEKALVYKRNGELLFALLGIDAKDSNDIPLLPTVLVRGHFVSVVTCLKEKETNERYFLLVKQIRVATGSIFYEHPAGMCDSEIDPYTVALKEVKEETGLSIKRDNLELLWEEPLYSSPGLLDEAGYFFSCEIELTKKEIDEYRDKLTGAEGESEFIETFVCPAKDIMNYIKNSSGIMSTLLFARKKGIEV